MMNISLNIVLGHRNVFRGVFYVDHSGDGGDRYLPPSPKGVCITAVLYI